MVASAKILDRSFLLTPLASSPSILDLFLRPLRSLVQEHLVNILFPALPDLGNRRLQRVRQV